METADNALAALAALYALAVLSVLHSLVYTKHLATNFTLKSTERLGASTVCSFLLFLLAIAVVKTKTRTK